MASRFLFQKFSGMMTKSANRLGGHASAEGCITLNSLFHGSAVHPGSVVTSGNRIQGYAARYFNVLPCSCTYATTSGRTTGMPSIVINRTKPASTDCIKRAKGTCSSGEDNKHRVPSPATEIKEYTAAWNRESTTIVVLCTAIAAIWFYPSGNRKSSNKSQSKYRHCEGCCCMAGGSKPTCQ